MKSHKADIKKTLEEDLENLKAKENKIDACDNDDSDGGTPVIKSIVDETSGRRKHQANHRAKAATSSTYDDGSSDGEE
jgi:hypothetical protein